MARVLLVTACALVDADGRVLLTRRPEGKALGGLWEFPGGKVEEGEAVGKALARELREELGIEVLACSPLMTVSHDYADKAVLLDVWRVTAFMGEPQGLEGQPVRWVPRHALADYEFPEANTPIMLRVCAGA